MDIEHLFHSVQAKDANHTEMELKYLIAAVPTFETECKVTGQCKADFDHIEGIAKFMLNATMNGDWNSTDGGLHRMAETLEHIKKDCSDHPTPPHPDECKEAVEHVEGALKGLNHTIATKSQQGTAHFS